jgi:hypothetical protein
MLNESKGRKFITRYALSVVIQNARLISDAGYGRRLMLKSDPLAPAPSKAKLIAMKAKW